MPERHPKGATAVMRRFRAARSGNPTGLRRRPKLDGGTNMLTKLREMGLTSDHMFAAGMASIGLSFLSWLTSKKTESTERADRWGIFVGEWAPTFFALGSAMRIDELRRGRKFCR
ncbi:hypothetical protein A8924_6987 [Saccharopolyspora erythraea NRRL 2338]|nr:hypothetical protein A8924_6987 [Saccharopolyspora erythraea NRRL 2338]